MEPDEGVELPPVIVGPTDEPVSLPSPQGGDIPPTPQVAAQRATKTEIGLGPVLNKTADDLRPDFAAGKEQMIRNTAAAALDAQKAQANQEKITQLAQKYGPLSSQQVHQILDPFNPANASTDPDSVIEKSFAKSYMSQLATAPAYVGNDVNVFNMAAREIPKQANDTMATGDDLLSKNQYLLKELQNEQQKLAGQSWLGWGFDQLKQLSQLYPEYKQRGIVDNTYIGGIGLGSNLEEQSNLLYGKPFDEFKAIVDSTRNSMDPTMRTSWLHSMYGQDTFEKVLNNVFTAAAIPDLAAGGMLAKKLLTFNQIRTAAKDMVISAARDPNPTRQTIAEGAGDVSESAVLQTAQGVMKAVEGSADPIGTARNTLLTVAKDIRDNATANPGTYLSREQLTRLNDGLDKDLPNLLSKIETMNRVERNPQANTEAVVRAYKDHLKDNYTGPNSMVGDVDGPFLEPASNTKWFRVHLLDYDGNPFSSSATAMGRADQMGIHAIDGTAGEKVYVPEAPFKRGTFQSVEQTGDTARFFDDNNIEIQSSPTPQPGLVPYNLKTGKFEPTLTAQTASVEQQGLGFRIVHWVPMRETDDFLRDLMIKDTSGKTVPETVSMSSSSGTKSIINSVLGWVRNSDETMALNENIQRKAVAYSQSNIFRWAQGLNKEIEKIKGKGDWWKPTAYLGKLPGKEVSAQFERTLDEARRTQSFFKSPGELQDFYLRSFSRNPSFMETKAYFNYVKLIEGDRMLGEIAEFRNRARVGAEQHRLRLIGPDGKPIYSNFFDGVTLSRLPGVMEDNVLIMGDKPGEEKLQSVGKMDKRSKGKLNEDIQQGRKKLIEVYDIDHNPLSDFSDVAREQRVRYVVSNAVESKPIAFNHVNRKEGGHFDWDYDHFIKQADVRAQRTGKYVYVGDKTVMPIGSRSLGANVVKLWNEAHELMKAGKWDEVRNISDKLGIDHQMFTGWYKAGRDEAGKPTVPKLNFHEPMYVVPKGKKISDLGSQLRDRYRINGTDRFHDGTHTGFANNFKVAYNTERHTDFNYRTINDIGTAENPIYAYRPAKLVDPLSTMNRAFNRAVSSSFMDDYKLYAIEHWLREAEPHLDVQGGKNAIRSAPFWHYNNPEFAKATPANIKWNLLSHKYKIDTFVGIPSKFDTWVHTFTEHLADVAYQNYGPEENRTFAQKARTITPIWLLHRVKNPVDFIRGVTFNFKLGLFNPAQFLVQAQTHSLIWSLEPRHGTVGTFGMLLHGWSRVNRNPAILRSLDDYYTRLNMFGSKAKPGEFIEAMNELDKTGFEHVAGEYANLSKAYMPTTQFVTNDVKKGLKLGQTPFRLGEQSTRVTAWYTAFRKFREENPTTPITNTERGKILNHADTLTVNMSRASSSALNHGVFSLSTQFLSYQIKLAELFLGNRTTALQKARILTGFSLLYGLPNAVGVTGLPISDTIRSELNDYYGYIPGENWLSTALNEGLPSWMLAMITGKGDLQAGNVENVGDRFGSQGWQNIKQGLRSDIPWWQAIGGAGVSTMANFMSSQFEPFYQGVLSWIRQDSNEDKFKIKAADLIQPWKEISTINNGIKMWTAIQTGKWISKNEGYEEDVSPLRAAFLATMGMNPQDQDDAFLNNQIVKGEEEAIKEAGKKYIKDMHRSYEAFSNGDPEQGNEYMRNAMAYMTAVGASPEDILKYQAISAKGWESMINSSDYSFWTRGDFSKRDQRFEQYQRKLQLQQKRQQ